ncbi:MAG: glycosyltransferase [Rhodopila sp.]|nr:glycosyltransferase [Rhodopila sp.]
MNPVDPTISVIIPLYNGGRFIAQALDSVFAQSLPPTEVIVVDDGSTDDGPEIVARYAAQHSLVLLRKANGGQSSARNFGISHSQGRLIALLDQDDIWYPDHLEELSRPFFEDTYRTLGWTYSNLDEITEDNRLRIRAALSVSPGQHPKTKLDKCLRQDMFVLPSAAMISRAAFDAVGGFDEDLCGYEDDDLFVRLFVAGYRNVYIKKPLAQWRVYGTSSSYTPRMARSRMLYARKLLRSFPDEPAFARFYSRDIIAPRFLGQVVDATRVALRLGDPEIIDACMEDISFLERYISPTRKSHLVRKELLITAVIPLYNGAPFIREALQSILEQTLPPDEIIVVDDGSTDTGPDIVAEMAKQHPIRLLRKENGGQSAARNLGVKHAHGDLIAFLDQDDAWYPNHLAELIKPFLETRAVELGWSYSNLDETNERGEMITRGFLNPLMDMHPKRDLASCLKQDMFILPSASLIARRAFLSIGGFDERLSGYEDDDLFLRMFLAGFDNVYIPESLSMWRIYQSSSSYTPRMAVSRAIYADKLISQFPNDRDRSRYYVRDLIAPRFFRHMATELRKATLKGTKDQQVTALANLTSITRHLRFQRRVLLQLLFLPAMHVPPLARLIMRYRATLYNAVRLIF